MKKTILFLSVILVQLAKVNIVTPYYNSLTNDIFCESTNCIHEVAHFIDDKNNWISESKEFREYFKNVSFYGINGVDKFRPKNIKDVMMLYDFIFGWGGWKEFYAYNFEKYYGCENLMPEPMKKFYDFEMAYIELKKYGIDQKSICPVIGNIIHSKATLK